MKKMMLLLVLPIFCLALFVSEAPAPGTLPDMSIDEILYECQWTRTADRIFGCDNQHWTVRTLSLRPAPTIHLALS